MGETLDSLFPGQRPVLLDGAMGTALRAEGWPRAEPSVLANLDAPEIVAKIHRSHVASGARVVTTNTFSALMLTDARCVEAVRVGARIARSAAGRDGKVAGTVAAFGLAVDDPQLSDVVTMLVEEGVDLIVFETCNKARDASRALELRHRVAPQVPAVVSASTTDGDRDDHNRVREIIAVVHAADEPQVEVGLNCCRGPHDALRLALSSAPVVRWVKPSTGLGDDRVDDSVMAAFARAAGTNSVRFIGGCCGTTAETIAAMASAIEAVAE